MLSNKEGRRKKGVRKRQREREQEGGKEKRKIREERRKGGRLTKRSLCILLEFCKEQKVCSRQDSSCL